MNIRLGLERISADWWGLWGLLAGLCLLAPFITDASDRWLIAGMGRWAWWRRTLPTSSPAG